MNERVVPKMTNSCVVKLSNSPAIACAPRLELDHFESQPGSPRINQRFLGSPIGFDRTLGYTDENYHFMRPRDNPLVLST